MKYFRKSCHSRSVACATSRELRERNLKRVYVPYARLYIASLISGRSPALNLNRSVRADRIDAIDFFSTRLAGYTYMYGAVREQLKGTLSMYELEHHCLGSKKTG